MNTQHFDRAPRHFTWLTQDVRHYLYLVMTALVPLLVIYGILDDKTAPLWIGLIGSITASGTAVLHTPRTPPHAPDHEVTTHNQTDYGGTDNSHEVVIEQ